MQKPDTSLGQEIIRLFRGIAVGTIQGDYELTGGVRQVGPAPRFGSGFGANAVCGTLLGNRLAALVLLLLLDPIVV